MCTQQNQIFFLTLVGTPVGFCNLAYAFPNIKVGLVYMHSVWKMNGVYGIFHVRKSIYCAVLFRMSPLQHPFFAPLFFAHFVPHLLHCSYSSVLIPTSAFLCGCRFAQMFTTAMDKRVNEQLFICPGMGNFGDRWAALQGFVTLIFLSFFVFQWLYAIRQNVPLLTLSPYLSYFGTEDEEESMTVTTRRSGEAAKAQQSPSARRHSTTDSIVWSNDGAAPRWRPGYRHGRSCNATPKEAHVIHCFVIVARNNYRFYRWSYRLLNARYCAN